MNLHCLAVGPLKAATDVEIEDVVGLLIYTGENKTQIDNKLKS